MSNLLERTGDSFKALLQQGVKDRRLKFMPSRTNGAYSGYGGGNVGFMADGLINRGLVSGGTGYDLNTLCPDVLDNSVVAACVNAIAQALPEAPIILEKRMSATDWDAIGAHPVLDLLRNPNPYLSEAELWGITTAFERTRGEAYWYFEYGASKTTPKEIWFRAPQFVEVMSDEQRFISGYRIQSEAGQQIEMDEESVIHFRHQLSPYNPRAGWNPIQTGRRQIIGDNGAARYHGAILNNAGAASLIISLKDAAAAGEVTPGQMDEYIQMFKRKVSGEGAGAILGLDLPLDVHKVGFSPDELALEKLLEYYESRICALMGVNRRVINLGTDPTYENASVALRDFWTRTLVPMRNRHASTLSSQLLPLFGLDPAIYRLRFDYSGVPELKEDEEAKHAMHREDLKAGGIDVYRFQTNIGIPEEEIDGSLKGKFVFPAPAKPNTNSMENQSNSDETKAVKPVVDVTKPQSLPKWTDEEIAAATTEYTEEDLKLMVGLATPEKRALLTAKEPDDA